MVIKTKFDKDQEVFFFRVRAQLFPVISKGTVTRVWITKDGSVYYEIEFRVGKNKYTSKTDVEERFIFSSEKEARECVGDFIKSDYEG